MIKIIRCKEVATLISKGTLADQPYWCRLWVRAHLMFCRSCQRFKKQIALITGAARDMAAGFDAEVDGDFSKQAQ